MSASVIRSASIAFNRSRCHRRTPNRRRHQRAQRTQPLRPQPTRRPLDPRPILAQHRLSGRDVKRPQLLILADTAVAPGRMGTPSSHHVLHHVAASPLPLQPRDREPKLVYPGQNQPLRSATGASARITRSLDRAIARTRASHRTQSWPHTTSEIIRKRPIRPEPRPCCRDRSSPDYHPWSLLPRAVPAVLEPTASVLVSHETRDVSTSLADGRTASGSTRPSLRAAAAPTRLQRRQKSHVVEHAAGSLPTSEPSPHLRRTRVDVTVNARVSAGASPNDHDRFRVDRKITVHAYRSGGSLASRSSPSRAPAGHRTRPRISVPAARRSRWVLFYRR